MSQSPTLPGFLQAVGSQNPLEFGRSLDIQPHFHPGQNFKQPHFPDRLFGAIDASERQIQQIANGAGLGDFLLEYCRMRQARNQSNLKLACHHANRCFQAALSGFESQEERWVSGLVAVTAACRLLAEEADRKYGGEKYREAFINSVRPVLGRVGKDADAKAGLVTLLYQLVKTMFSLRNIHQASKLLSAQGLQGSDQWVPKVPRGAMVQFCYVWGRVRMYNEEWGDAENKLAYAFNNCICRPQDRDDSLHKRMILEVLLPVRLRLGQFPPPSLLQQYGLEQQYGGVVAALRTGNVGLFNDTLRAHRGFFVRNTTFLAVEKLKTLVYRRLVQRIVTWRAKEISQGRLLFGESPTSPNQVPLYLFEEALRSMQPRDDPAPVDADEVACTLANLIHQGLLKGYISHEHQKLVLPNVIANAFPLPSALFADQRKTYLERRSPLPFFQ